MQFDLISVAIVFILAIAILFFILLLGVGVAYRDEIGRTNISFYARVIITPLLLFVSVFLYVQGALNPDILFIGIICLLPILLCTDWSQVRKTKIEQE